MLCGMSVFNSSIQRTATTNAAGNMSAPVAAVHVGLHSVAESVNRLAEYLGDHPDEMGAATEAAESVGKQFRALVESAAQFESGNMRLEGMVGEMDKTADWIDCRFPQTERRQSHAMPLSGGQQSATLPVNNAFSGRIFNAGATALPVVSSFNDLHGR